MIKGDNCVIVTDSENFRPMLCTRKISKKKIEIFEIFCFF